MTGRIRYAGFSTPRHSGGVHVMTQHVQLLRAAGHDAWLWLPEDRPGWIDATVPAVIGPTLDIGEDDLLVLPEVPIVPGLDPAPGARKVIFNQNHFYTYAAAPDCGQTYPGWSPPPAVWAVSAESRDVLAGLLIEPDIQLVPNPVDGELFRPRSSVGPRVSWFPRKRPREASLLARLLAADPRLAGVDRQPLTNAPRATVAQVLGATTVFVSLGHSESFGLPVAEALASGCLVVGYDGGGGCELFEAPGAWRLPEQRPLLLRDAVADLLTRSGELTELRAENRAWVLQRYGFHQTAAALETAVAAAFGRPGGSATARHPAGWVDTLGPNFTAYA